MSNRSWLIAAPVAVGMVVVAFLGITPNNPSSAPSQGPSVTATKAQSAPGCILTPDDIQQITGNNKLTEVFQNVDHPTKQFTLCSYVTPNPGSDVNRQSVSINVTDLGSNAQADLSFNNDKRISDEVEGEYNGMEIASGLVGSDGTSFDSTHSFVSASLDTTDPEVNIEYIQGSYLVVINGRLQPWYYEQNGFWTNNMATRVTYQQMIDKTNAWIRNA